MERIAYLLGPRSRVLLAVLLAGGWAVWQLDLDLRGALPSSPGWTKAAEFFSAAAHPAVAYERTPPPGTVPLLRKVLAAIGATIAFAVASVSLAVVGGLALGFLASSAWWEDDPLVGRNWFRRCLNYGLAPLLVWSTRTLIIFARSIHELLWAVLFMSAMGFNTMTAILSIAIPYTGVFAKVFSEMIDEAPRDAAYAVRGLGARPIQVFLFGLLPRALPDMSAYFFYRLECGMRSCAVLGFFGIPTLGYYLQPAFDEQHYREVWTYLYALLGLIVAADWWSGLLRRRIVR